MRTKTMVYCIILTIVISAFPVGICSSDITVPSNAYFGIPTYGTYISFSEEQTFNSISRISNNWHFDNYQFSIQNANMTITRLFTQDIFEATGTSTGTESALTINAVDAGYNYAPKYVRTGVTPSGWSWAAGTLTVTGYGNDLNYYIDWSSPEQGGSIGFYSLSKIDTYLSILPSYSNYTVWTDAKIKIEGSLTTVQGEPIVDRLIILTTSWGFSNQTLTTMEGTFSVSFTVTNTPGKYQLQLQYNGDDTYNPSLLNIPLNVVGEAQKEGFAVSVPLLFVGIFILIVVAVIVAASWSEKSRRA